MEIKSETGEASRSDDNLSRHVLHNLRLCTGDMEHVDVCMQGNKSLTS